jgi:hypothetical protein
MFGSGLIQHPVGFPEWVCGESSLGGPFEMSTVTGMVARSQTSNHRKRKVRMVPPDAQIRQREGFAAENVQAYGDNDKLPIVGNLTMTANLQPLQHCQIGNNSRLLSPEMRFTKRKKPFVYAGPGDGLFY